MSYLPEIGAIFSVIGIPSIFTLMIYLHKKHAEILYERIRLLEDEKRVLENSTSDKLMALLEKRKQDFKNLLSNSEEMVNEQKAEYEARVDELNGQIKALQRDNEILEIMSDARGGTAKSQTDECQGEGLFKSV